MPLTAKPLLIYSCIFHLLIEIMLPHLEIVFEGIISSNCKVHCHMGAPDLLNQSFIGYLDVLQLFSLL